MSLSPHQCAAMASASCEFMESIKELVDDMRQDPDDQYARETVEELIPGIESMHEIIHILCNEVARLNIEFHEIKKGFM